MRQNVTTIGRFAAVLLIVAGCTNSPAQTAPAEKSRELWEVFFIQGQRVGYGHTSIVRKTEAGKEIVRTENVTRMTIRRGEDVSTQVISGSSVETPDGQVLGFSSKIQMGPGSISFNGAVREDKLNATVTGPGETTPRQLSIPWSSDYRGPFADVLSLLRKPMTPGEKRTIKKLEISLNQIVVLELAAKDYERVNLLDGEAELLRIDAVTRMKNGQELKAAVWCNRSGEALKTIVEVMDITSYRVSKKEALKSIEGAELDMMPDMLVKVDKKLSNPYQTKKARYRVHWEKGDPEKAFAAGATQRVESLDPHTAEITVYAIRPDVKSNPEAAAEKATDDDLRPNSIIQSDNPLVRANAAKAVGDRSDPWRVAVALEKFVNREVKKKNFTQAFATAAEVAKSGEGDCSEHAVYLAALARARGIPARVAFGLVYDEGLQAFGFHAWTEVFIKDRWIPIDGTLALGGVGAAHLKISSSNFKESSFHGDLLPIVKLIGALRIEILDQAPDE
ncbi:MAG: transglutaminase family protein [Pirellulales bacterium]|nr:transglutaminase family protein [Pirellulales bacterium]